jgi:hypothetical protein
MTLTNVTISGNTAGGNGGGTCCGGGTSTNVTISGNTAGGSGGGMIEAHGGAMTLTNVTISGNSASSGGGIFNFDGTATLTNSIIANNSGGDCANSSTLNFSGVNIVKDGSCTGPGVLAVDPKLGTLGSNGGFVQTIPLLAGSLAINALPFNLPCPPTDARGRARPHPAILAGFAYCDLGAFEK